MVGRPLPKGRPPRGWPPKPPPAAAGRPLPPGRKRKTKAAAAEAPVPARVAEAPARLIGEGEEEDPLMPGGEKPVVVPGGRGPPARDDAWTADESKEEEDRADDDIVVPVLVRKPGADASPRIAEDVPAPEAPAVDEDDDRDLPAPPVGFEAMFAEPEVVDLPAAGDDATEEKESESEDERSSVGERSSVPDDQTIAALKESMGLFGLEVSDRVLEDKKAKDEAVGESEAMARAAALLVKEEKIEVEVEIYILACYGLMRNSEASRQGPQRSSSEALVRKSFLGGLSPGPQSGGTYVRVVGISADGEEKVWGETKCVVTRSNVSTFDQEKVTAVVPYDDDDGNEAYKVRLDVYDKVRGSQHDSCLGEVTLDRDQMIEEHHEEAFVRPLKPPPSYRLGAVAGHEADYHGAVEMRLHLSGRVVVYVDGARHLLAADPEGTSDPYATCQWFGYRKRKIGRTKTAQATLCPSWAAAFIVPVPLLRSDHGGRIQLDVWDDDWLGSDDFLGRVTLEAEWLLRQRTLDPVIIPLERRKAGEKVQGSVEVRVAVPVALFDLATRLRTASWQHRTNNDIPRCHVRLRVRRACDIRNADCCGHFAGDPYAVVYYDDRKVGRTPKRNSTRNPVWDSGENASPSTTTTNLFTLRDVPTRCVHDRNPWDEALDEKRRGVRKGTSFFRGGGGGGPRKKSVFASKPPKNDDDDESPSGGPLGGEIDLGLYDFAGAPKRAEDDYEDDHHGETTDFAHDRQGGAEEAFDDGDDDEEEEEEGGNHPTEAKKNISIRRRDRRVADEADHDVAGERDEAPEDDVARIRAQQRRRDEASAAGEPLVDVHIDVFDDDLVTRDFLGRAEVPWRVLMTPGDHELTLADRPGAKVPLKTKERYRTTGSLVITISHVAIVEGRVCEAVGLAQVDAWDVSDPYCVVKWGSETLVRTKVRDDSLDPFWYNDAFFACEVPLSPEPAEDPPDRLVVEVWEANAFSRDDFMGYVYLNRDAVLAPSPGLPRDLARRVGEAEDPAPQGTLEVEVHASFIPIVLESRRAEKMRFRPLKGRDAHAPTVEVRLKILRAGGLLNMDVFGGADPFVIVRHDGHVVGRTATRNNTLKPVWRDEIVNFAFTLTPAGEIADARTQVHVEVWDSDLGGKQLMGIARLGVDQLLRAGVCRYALAPLKPSRAFCEDPDHVDPGLGWVEICCEPYAALTLEVERAESVRAADSSGTSDPYCLVRWVGPREHTLGKSEVNKRTLSPRWAYQVSMSVPLTAPLNQFASVVVEVWDFDPKLDRKKKNQTAKARSLEDAATPTALKRRASLIPSMSAAGAQSPDGAVLGRRFSLAALSPPRTTTPSLLLREEKNHPQETTNGDTAGLSSSPTNCPKVDRRPTAKEETRRSSVKEVGASPTTKADEEGTEPEDVGEDEFLGLCVIDPHELIAARCLAAQDGSTQTRKLMNRERPEEVSKRATGTVSWRVLPSRPVKLLRKRLARDLAESLTVNHLDGTTVKFEILECRGLRRSTFGGSSDSYFRAFCHGEPMGRTSVAKHTMDPVWPGDGSQAFTVKNVPTRFAESRAVGDRFKRDFCVRLACFGAGAIGSDEARGECKLTWAQLMAEEVHVLDLRGTVLDPSRVGEKQMAARRRVQAYAEKMGVATNFSDDSYAPPTPRRNSNNNKGEGGLADFEEENEDLLPPIEENDDEEDEETVASGEAAAPMMTTTTMTMTTTSVKENEKKPTTKAPATTPQGSPSSSSSAAFELLQRKRKKKKWVYPQVWVRVWHIARVRIHLLGALGLQCADRDRAGRAAKADPYAIVRDRGKRVATTRVHKKTADPVWNHLVTLELETYAPAGVGADTAVQVEVWDRDVFGADDFLGSCAISRSELLFPHAADLFACVPQPNAKPGVARPSGFVELRVEASYIPGSLEPVPWPRRSRRQSASSTVAAYYPEGVPPAALTAAQYADWQRRDIREAVDGVTGKPFWYERLHGEALERMVTTRDYAACRRWWRDPRPLEPAPCRTFEPGPPPPRPSPAKKFYADINEPRPGDVDYGFKACAVVEVVVLRAQGLRRADAFSKSDPYAVVRYGSAVSRETVGRTRHVSNSLDPVWGDEPIRFPCRLDADCATQDLVIELWDYDGALASLVRKNPDDGLGQCTISAAEYLNATAPIRKPLRPQPGEPPCKGWVEVRVSVLGQVRVTVEAVRRPLQQQSLGLGATTSVAAKHRRRRSSRTEEDEDDDDDDPLERRQLAIISKAASSRASWSSRRRPGTAFGGDDDTDSVATTATTMATAREVQTPSPMDSASVASRASHNSTPGGGKTTANNSTRAGADSCWYDCVPTWRGWHERTFATVRPSRRKQSLPTASFVVDVPLTRAGGRLDLAVTATGKKSKRRRFLGTVSFDAEVLVSANQATKSVVYRKKLRRGGHHHHRKQQQQQQQQHPGDVDVRVDCPEAVSRLALAARAARELQETGNTIPLLDALEIDILRAFNLQVMDSRSLSDPFVAVYHRGARVGQTRGKPNTLNPVWDADGASATVSIPNFRTADDDAHAANAGGMGGFDRAVRGVLFEVLDADGPSTDFLGHCLLRHEALLRPGEHELILHEDDDAEMLVEASCAKHGTGTGAARWGAAGRLCSRCCSPCVACCAVTRDAAMGAYAIGTCATEVLCPGVSRCLVRTCPKHCAPTAPVRGRLLVRVRHRARVELRICEAYLLKNADGGTRGGGGGVSDPYCIVEFEGKQLAKTKVKANTLDPYFYEAVALTLDVPLSPFGWDADKRGRDNNNDDGGEGDNAQGTILRWDHPGRAFQRTTGGLTVSVWDRDTLSKDDFLGQVVLRPDVLLKPQNGTVWRLRDRGFTHLVDERVDDDDDNKNEDLGYLDLRIDASRVPGTTLDRTLRRQDGALGRYVETTTRHGRRYFFDVWTKETFWVSPGVVAQEERAQLLEHDKFLLTPPSAPALGSGGGGARKDGSPLVPTERGTAPLVDSLLSPNDKGGSSSHIAHLSLDHSDAPQVVIRLFIVRAKGLDRLDVGLDRADVYVVVRCAGIQVGETAVRKDPSNNPQWFEAVTFAAPLPTETSTEVSVEVWNRVYTKSDDLAGTAYVSSMDLFRRNGQFFALSLTAPPGAKLAHGAVWVRPEMFLRTGLEVRRARVHDVDAKAETYCALQWRGKYGAREMTTSTVFNGTDPRWHNERFTLLVPLTFPPPVLTIQVREHRRTKNDLFIGKLNLDAITLAAEFGKREAATMMTTPGSAEELVELRFPLLEHGEDFVSRPCASVFDAVTRAPMTTGMSRRLGGGGSSYSPEGAVVPDAESIKRSLELRWNEAAGEDEMAAGSDSDGEAVVGNPLLAKAALGGNNKGSRSSSMMVSLTRIPMKLMGAEEEEVEEDEPHKPRREKLRGSFLQRLFFSRGSSRDDAWAKPKVVEKDTAYTKPRLAVRRPSSAVEQPLGDSLIVRVVAPRAVSALYAEARTRWRQQPSANRLARIKCEVEILKADGLRPSDFFTGSADPYVIVTLGGETVGKTRVLHRTLNPKWLGEHFELPDFPGEPLTFKDAFASRVEFKVMDSDLVGRDDYLGYKVLDHDDLLEKVGEWRTVNLADNPDKASDPAQPKKQQQQRQQQQQPNNAAVRKKKQRKCGTLTFRVTLVALVKLDILTAFDLPSRRGAKEKKTTTTNAKTTATDDDDDEADEDDVSSVEEAAAGGDPPNAYVRVRYLGRQCGEDTPLGGPTRRPAFFHTVHLQVQVPPDEKYGEPVYLELWDEDLTSKEETLIGIVEVAHEDLLYPFDHPAARPVYAEPLSLEEHHQLRADPADVDPRPTRGFLEICVEASRVPGKTLEPRRRAMEAPVYKEARDPRTDEAYWYDVCTGERFWDDPRPAADALAAALAEHAAKRDSVANHKRLLDDGGAEGTGALPLELVRAQKGFPDAPRGVCAAGSDQAAHVWWTAPRQNGPRVTGYTVERQRRTRDTGFVVAQHARSGQQRAQLLDDADDDPNWTTKGTVYIDAAQAEASLRQAGTSSSMWRLAKTSSHHIEAAAAAAADDDDDDDEGDTESGEGSESETSAAETMRRRRRSPPKERKRRLPRPKKRASSSSSEGWASAPPPTQCILNDLSNGVFYRFRVYSHNTVGASTPSRWSNPVHVMRPLPEGWIQLVTADGDVYFQNVKTKQTTWVRPETDPFYLPTDVFLRFQSLELEQLRRLFVDKDFDRSNAISLGEFEECLPECGEFLSNGDVMWLFYQADLDPSNELSFTQFAKCVDTLKRARMDHAPFYRKVLESSTNVYEYYTRPRVGTYGHFLLANKNVEIAAKFSAWERLDHPELEDAKYWVNRETGDATFATPPEIRFFIPDALFADAMEIIGAEGLADLEQQFDMMDIDGSGSIDASELKLLIGSITGDSLSDGRCRGLVAEVDADGSGAIDFDEFVLIILTIRRGSGGHGWGRIGAGMAKVKTEDLSKLRERQNDLKREQRRLNKNSINTTRRNKRPHGHYCVCGCRADADDDPARAAKLRRAQRHSIFPKLSERQLQRQARGGGSSAARALESKAELDSKTPGRNKAVVAYQAKAARNDEPPKWSMLLHQHRENFEAKAGLADMARKAGTH